MSVEKLWKPVWNIIAIIFGILFIKEIDQKYDQINTGLAIFYFIAGWASKFIAEYGEDWFDL
jgi:hypothetical protein